MIFPMPRIGVWMLAVTTVAPALARTSRPAVWSRLATLAMMTVAAASAHAQRPQAARCDQAPVDTIPGRASGAPAGSEFARQVESISGLERDTQIQSQLVSGNVPQFLR